MGKDLAEVTSDMVTSDVTEASGHINFFQDAEKGEDKVTTNAEHEAEKERKALDFDDVKDIKKVEKKHKKKERKRSRSRSRGKKRNRSRSRESRHKKKKSKDKKSKKKRRRRSSSSSSDSDSSSDGDSAEKKAIAKKNLEKLRRERLERERAERQKADRLVFGECEEDKKKKQEEEEREKKQRYSSQFNPDLAKQNKLDPKRKYWQMITRKKNCIIPEKKK